MNCKTTPSNKQQGYVSVLALMLFSAIGLTLFGLYNSGHQTTEKMRMQNSADATAYSTTTTVSRDLNFMAYTNRAMVANQVAIAQFVGMSSWTNMMKRSTRNLQIVASWFSWVPVVGQIVNAIITQLNALMQQLSTIVDQVARVMVPILDGLIQGISIAQNAYHYQSLLSSYETFLDVSTSNDNDISTGFISRGYNTVSAYKAWDGFTKQYTPPDVRGSSNGNGERKKRFNDEFANIVRDSRDAFSKERSYRWFRIPTVPFVIRMEVRKYGGTDLNVRSSGGSQKYTYDWTAMDTVSLWTRRYKCSWRGCGWRGWRETIPIGWGAGHALQNNKRTFNFNSQQNVSNYGNGAWRNSRAAKRARDIDRANSLGTTQGLANFYDIVKRGQLKESDMPNIKTLLLKDDSKVRTVKTIARNNASYTLQPSFNVEEKGTSAGDSLAALSKAQVYFSRPRDLWDWKRADSKREYSNLYNPFWQVRLTETSNGERTTAINLSSRF